VLETPVLLIPHVVCTHQSAEAAGIAVKKPPKHHRVETRILAVRKALGGAVTENFKVNYDTVEYINSDSCVRTYADQSFLHSLLQDKTMLRGHVLSRHR